VQCALKLQNEARRSGCRRGVRRRRQERRRTGARAPPAGILFGVVHEAFLETGMTFKVSADTE
jgi:hypothetical protein